MQTRQESVDRAQSFAERRLFYRKQSKETNKIQLFTSIKNELVTCAFS